MTRNWLIKIEPEVGREIKRRQELMGLRNAELSQQSGVGYRTIQRLRNMTEVRFFNTADLNSICRILNTSLQEIQDFVTQSKPASQLFSLMEHLFQEIYTGNTTHQDYYRRLIADFTAYHQTRKASVFAKFYQALLDHYSAKPETAISALRSLEKLSFEDADFRSEIKFRQQIFFHLGYFLRLQQEEVFALRYYAEAKRISEKMGDEEGVANANFLTAEVFFQRGDFSQIIVVLEDPIESELVCSAVLKGRTLLMLAETYSRLGRVNQATAYGQQAINILKEEDNAYYLAEATFWLAEHYRIKNCLDQAITLTQSGMTILQDWVKARPNHAAGQLLIGNGRHRQALIPSQLGRSAKSIEILRDLVQIYGIDPPPISQYREVYQQSMQLLTELEDSLSAAD